MQMFKFGVFESSDHPHADQCRQQLRHTERWRARLVSRLRCCSRTVGTSFRLTLPKSTPIALIGQATFANAAASGGGGSSRVAPTYTVTPLQGLQNVLTRLGSSATVNLVVVANNNSNLAAAVSAAQAADVAIVMSRRSHLRRERSAQSQPAE